MNKQALIEAVAAEGNVSKAEAERRLNTVLTVISKGLQNSGSVMLTGIGKLRVVTRKARAGRNPNNGSTLQIPAKKVLKLKQSTQLEI